MTDVWQVAHFGMQLSQVCVTGFAICVPGVQFVGEHRPPTIAKLVAHVKQLDADVTQLAQYGAQFPHVPSAFLYCGGVVVHLTRHYPATVVGS